MSNYQIDSSEVEVDIIEIRVSSLLVQKISNKFKSRYDDMCIRHAMCLGVEPRTSPDKTVDICRPKWQLYRRIIDFVIDNWSLRSACSPQSNCTPLPPFLRRTFRPPDFPLVPKCPFRFFRAPQGKMVMRPSTHKPRILLRLLRNACLNLPGICYKAEQPQGSCSIYWTL